MATKVFPYSDFLRTPKNVLPALEEGDVLLERRDDEDLVLVRRARYGASLEGLGLVSEIFRRLYDSDYDLAERLLVSQLPWVRWLPVGDRKECLIELMDDLSAGAETGSFFRFVQDLHAWRGTAEVWSDPELASRLQGPFDGDGRSLSLPSEE